MQHNKLLAATLALTFGACAADTDDMADMPDMPDTTATPQSFKLRIENVAPWKVLKSGAQTMKNTGAMGALGPEEYYDLTFTAGKNQKVSFASMLGESNDWLFATGPAGISLYDASGNPVSGDVTSQIKLYDAGTEIDQEPGVGDAVGPNQPAPDFGAPDTNPLVRELGQRITLSNFSVFTMPAMTDMIKVTLTPRANRQFTLRIQNVSTATTLATSEGARSIHISPPVWAVHIADAPLFSTGSVDRGQGLELIAEAGRFQMLASVMHTLSGFHTPVSPGVYALHQDPEPLYSLGLADRGEGLEFLAEDGNTAILADAMIGIAARGALMETGVFEVPVSGDQRAPARPGDAYELTVQGIPGDYVSFATMFGMSNDWFFATGATGIPLFDANGEATKGDVTSYVALYDAGTELDQEPAIGPETGPQQPAANTGAVDAIQQVRVVPSSAYSPSTSAHLRVTLMPE